MKPRTASFWVLMNEGRFFMRMDGKTCAVFVKDIQHARAFRAEWQVRAVRAEIGYGRIRKVDAAYTISEVTP